MKSHIVARKRSPIKKARPTEETTSMYSLRIAAAALLVGAVAFLGGMYAKKALLAKNPPVVAQVDSYASYPPEIPQEFILIKNAPVTFSETVLRADGKKQSRAIWVSNDTMMNLLQMHTTLLESAGWKVKRSLNERYGFLTCTKDAAEGSVAIEAQGKITKVTISYTK